MHLTRRLGAAVGLALPAALLLPAPATADIDQDVACIELENSGTEDAYQTDATSLPLETLGIAEAQARAVAMAGGTGLPGAGVDVAVIDSGVYSRSPLLEVTPGENFANKSELLDYHGTAVAGLIAGKPRGDQATGIAPGARIIDVRVYDDDDASQEEGAAPVEIDRLVAGVKWVADNAAARDIDVAVIALRIGHSPALAREIRRLHRADVVIVAASGNRPTEDSDPLLPKLGSLLPGEDAAEVIFPAGYDDHVVAVNATLSGSPDEAEGGDVRTYVLQNSATDLAAPTYNGVSLGMNGSTCLLQDVATSWAAAQVSGVAALLRAAYPRESADQIIARLTETASGSTEDRHVLVGAGVVQPLEALTRPMTPSRRGNLDRWPEQKSTIPAATAPRPEADLLADARGEAVWFGLLGGGAVVLALLLRPILARRRG